MKRTLPIRDDNSSEPREVVVDTDQGTIFKGTTAVADLTPGTEIEAEIDASGGALSAPAKRIEVVTTREDMIRDIQTVQTQSTVDSPNVDTPSMVAIANRSGDGGTSSS